MNTFTIVTSRCRKKTNYCEQCSLLRTAYNEAEYCYINSEPYLLVATVVITYELYPRYESWQHMYQLKNENAEMRIWIIWWGWNRCGILSYNVVTTSSWGSVGNTTRESRDDSQHHASQLCICIMSHCTACCQYDWCLIQSTINNRNTGIIIYYQRQIIVYQC